MTKTIKRNICVLLTICLLFTSIVSTAEQEMSSMKKLEYMEQGEKLIDAFYDPSSHMYFGKKIDVFFNDENLKQVKTLIEEVAKARGVSTKQVMTDVMGLVFTKMVFEELTHKLAAIQITYKNSTSVEIDLNDPSVSSAIAAGAGGLVATLGIATAVLGIWGAMAVPAAGLWGALIIWWTGAALGWKAALAAILSGPWGWIVLAGMLVATVTGYAYYQKQAEDSKKEMIGNLKVQIEALKPGLVARWRESFELATIGHGLTESDKQFAAKTNSFFENAKEMFSKGYSDGKMLTTKKSLVPDKSVSEMIGLVPAEADFILVAKVNKLMEKPLAHKYLNENYLKTPEERAAYAEFISNTGLNVLEDIHDIVIFTSGDTGKNAVSGMILKGRFNANKICEVISKDPKASMDVDIKRIDGFNAIIPKNKNDGFGLFLDEKTAVIGTEQGVMEAKDIKLGKKQGLDNRKDFVSVINKFNINAHFSSAGLMPQNLKEKLKANAQTASLADINYYFIELDLDAGFKFNLGVEVNTIQNIDNVKTVLNGLLSWLKLIVKDQPTAKEIHAVLERVELKDKSTAITAYLDLSHEQLEEIFQITNKTSGQ